jgi:hypothetical protein
MLQSQTIEVSGDKLDMLARHSFRPMINLHVADGSLMPFLTLEINSVTRI